MLEPRKYRTRKQLMPSIFQKFCCLLTFDQEFKACLFVYCLGRTLLKRTDKGAGPSGLDSCMYSGSTGETLKVSYVTVS